MSDEMIMQSVANGDLDQLSKLFDTYHIYCYNFYRKKGHNKELSEDLTQAVFERILKYRASYKQTKSFKAWFFQIARNIETDHWSQNKMQKDDQVEVMDLQLQDDSFQQRMEANETLNRLEKAMNQLSKEEQELIHLSKYQGLRYKEIGTTLQITEGTARVKLYRAIKNLRSNYFKNERPNG